MKLIRLCLLFLFAATSLGSFAEDVEVMKVQADSAYAKEEYEEAVRIYTQIAEQVQDANICYNLGCCYYRLDDMAHSVLWFERASLLNPGDKDIRFNLELARSKTIDRITPRHEMFFVSLFRSLTQLFSLRQWAVICISLFIVCLLSLCLFLFSDKYLLRKLAFFVGIITLILVIFGNVCAYKQKSILQNRNSAIIVASSVTVKSTPSQSGNELFVLHEGTRVEIRDNTMKDWCEVQIADGKIGWVERNVMEII